MADAKLTSLTALSVPAVADQVYAVDVSDTTDDPAGSSRSLTIERLLGMVVGTANGRLTTETGVAVSTSDRTSQGTLYYTPYNGSRVALYDGTRWKLYTFTERSLALSGLTADKNYDVFLYDSAGTLTLELSAAWTNDTTRADALTTQDGVYVKSGSTTRRWLGTIRSTSTTATEDSNAKRFVWNAQNRESRTLLVVEASETSTYSTNTWRPYFNDTTNRVQYVCGLAGVAPVIIRGHAYAAHSTNPAVDEVGIGVDSTTAADTAPGFIVNISANNGNAAIAYYTAYASLGFHYLQLLERAYVSGGIATYYGTSGGNYLGFIEGELYA